MDLKRVSECVENSKIRQFLERAFSSYFFPLVSAFVTVGCYYLGWEVVTVWYICLSGAAIMVCCKDATPVISNFLFLNILVSLKHCPAYMGAGSKYLVSPPILAQEIIAVVIFFVPLFWRGISGIITKRFVLTPMFWGVVAFGVALMLGGSFYSHYSPMSFALGLGFAAILICIFVFFFGNIKIEKDTFIKIAYYLLVLFACVSFELIIAYLTYDGLIVNGVIRREKLFFGWGMYNNMGLLFVISIPAWFYLAGKFKYGTLCLIGAVFDVTMCYLCMSRQAMIMSIVVFAACCVWLLFWDRGRKRIINASIMAGVVLILAILAIVFKDKLKYLVEPLKNGLDTGNGRLQLWQYGMKNFFSKPLFGVGWYDPAAPVAMPGYTSGDLSYSVPRMCHNTVIQLLSSCGLCGFVTYVIHRAQTVISLTNDLSHERVFVAFTIFALAIVCIVDNHIFSPLITFVYAFLCAVLAKSERVGRKKISV